MISTFLGQATSVARSQRYRHLFVSLNRAPKSREESRERIEILKSWRVLLPLTFFQTILGSTTLHFFIRNSGPKYWARLQVNNKLSKPRKMFSGCYFLIERGVNFLNMVILRKKYLQNSVTLSVTRRGRGINVNLSDFKLHYQVVGSILSSSSLAQFQILAQT